MTQFTEVTPETVMGAWNLIKDFHYDTLIDAAVHGYHGTILVDDLEQPSICGIRLGGTSYFSGDVNHHNAGELIKQLSPWGDIIVHDEQWTELAKTIHKGHFKESKRYSFRHEQIDVDALDHFIAALPDHYTIMKIDRALASQLRGTKWGKYLVCNYKNIDDYLEKGAGFCILDGDQVVSGASSFISFNGGYEIEIDTHRDYRNQGLATAVAARFIKFCLEQDKIPHWDAENEYSIKLAKKLGFVIDREYDVLVIHN